MGYTRENAKRCDELFEPLQEPELIYSVISARSPIYMFGSASVEEWLFSDIKRLFGLDAKGRRMVSWRRKL